MSELSERDAKYLEDRIRNILFEHYRKKNCDLMEERFYPSMIAKPAARITEKCVEIINEELENDGK